MLDAEGRIRPDIERPPVSGFRAHAERVLRRWLAYLGLIWYARDFGGNLLELLNGLASVEILTRKSQELRQQARAEPGTTSARVSMTKIGDTVVIDATIDVRGYKGTLRINMNSVDLTAVIA
jgi:hypothetical protein